MALDTLGISYDIDEHPPACTIEEIEQLEMVAKGEILKNLFLWDSRGKRHILLCFCGAKRADLKSIAKQVGSGRLSFASEHSLKKHLGLDYGSVTPLGVLNDENAVVEVFFDRDLADIAKIGVHPNINTATLWLSFSSLLKAVQAHGKEVNMLTV